ncbi:MAG: hypothetical protein IPM29_32540 [Planctomycetes bacterium]|nr:hypothetical protein [Planctomycetota bacterium]
MTEPTDDLSQVNACRLRRRLRFYRLLSLALGAAFAITAILLMTGYAIKPRSNSSQPYIITSAEEDVILAASRARNAGEVEDAVEICKDGIRQLGFDHVIAYLIAIYGQNRMSDELLVLFRNATDSPISRTAFATQFETLAPEAFASGDWPHAALLYEFASIVRARMEVDLESDYFRKRWARESIDAGTTAQMRAFWSVPLEQLRNAIAARFNERNKAEVLRLCHEFDERDKTRRLVLSNNLKDEAVAENRYVQEVRDMRERAQGW